MRPMALAKEPWKSLIRQREPVKAAIAIISEKVYIYCVSISRRMHC
jgi:hypothetical protein